jgi:hypothetical protein
VAFLEGTEVYDSYIEACDEADIWRKDYPEYERLMDNGLMEGLDENLPEVNDGSLAASLFKLAKRVIKKKLSGRAVALDTNDMWITELANIQIEKKILKNANTMASPRRKWKDAVRKSAGYGGQPIITIFTDHGADFIVPYSQDVKLEAGKVSDEDSDIIFWDVYYTKLQVKNMIEQAENEMKNDVLAKEEYAARKEIAELNGEPFEEEEPVAYNNWNIPKLQEILLQPLEDRPGNNEHSEKMAQGVSKSGIHFYIAFQRGKDAPFMMCYGKEAVREWSNPDPTGDVPVHYLYCYQDFINPYGIGIVKLAGGTQNVLDYMRQADILATQVGIAPPQLIGGSADDVDEESMVMAQNAKWYIGNAQVTPWNSANGVYSELPNRIGMYQTSLQKIIPMGDTSIAMGDSGDSQVSKTPAGVKLQAANLSIDDEDFSENVDECYALVMKSMVNYQFANMQGSDLIKLTDDERKLLVQGGLEWNTDEMGELVGNELDILWDEVRATFDYEIDPDADKIQDEEKALEGKLQAYEMLNADPNVDMYLQLAGKKVDRGELLSDIFSSLTDNDKIIQDISPEEQEQMANEQQMAMDAGIDPATGQPLEPEMPMEEQPPQDLEEEQALVNMQAVMKDRGVDKRTALAMLEAEAQGFSREEIDEALMRNSQPAGVPVA